MNFDLCQPVLREKCPNTDQKKLRIWTLFMHSRNLLYYVISRQSLLEQVFHALMGNSCRLSFILKFLSDLKNFKSPFAQKFIKW